MWIDAAGGNPVHREGLTLREQVDQHDENEMARKSIQSRKVTLI